MVAISPKTRWNLSRIWPFGLIWLITGWVFLIVENIAAGGVNPDPSSAVTLTLPVFLFASLAVTAVGLLIGMLEMVMFTNLFQSGSFLEKLLYKFLLYSFLLMGIITITYPIATSIEFGTTPFHVSVWQRYAHFLTSLTFLSTLLQMGFSLILCLLYAGISENLGHIVLINLFTGRYHTPREEERIFMFLDMKSSTTIAEQLGHTRYFNLLQAYYTRLSEGIIRYEGEVYQYVGDEVVISWRRERGLNGQACLRCFYAMQADLIRDHPWFEKQFGVRPVFKAGLHLGNVTAGEVGALKKEVVFSGDVLNATSRIQGLCNRYDTDLLVSGTLISQLNETDGFAFKSLGPVSLSGKNKPVELFSVSRQELSA